MQNLEKYNLPIVVRLLQNENLIRENHNNLEILFALKGSATLAINGKKYDFKSGEIVLINNLESYQITNLIGIVATITIKRDKLNLDEKINTTSFYCNSLEYSNKNIFLSLEKKCYSLIKNYFGGNFSNIKALSYAYDIIDELVQNFPRTASSSKDQNNKMDNILAYIEENFQNDLSLNELAAEFGFSIPYLSNLFKKNLKLNFTQYYDQVRLRHSLEDLLKTNLPIIDIALKNGFASNHAFLRAYKQYYNELPSDTRKKKEINSSTDLRVKNEERSLNDIILDLEDDNRENIEDIIYDDININSYCEQKPVFTLNGKMATNCIAISNAANLAFEVTRKTILKAKKTLNVKYVNFLGIFSDGMYFCSRDRSGKLSFRYNLINEALDFLYQNDLIPMISLSFMPSVIAKNKNKTIFADEYNTSSPAKLEEWIQIIREFFNHIISRYKISKVLDWIFIPWRQPESGYNSMGFETDEIFLEFYKATHNTIKEINSSLIVSSPEMMPITNRRYEWFEKFMIWTKRNNCLPDCLAIEYYADSNWDIIDTYSIKGKSFNSIPYVKPNVDQSSMHKFLVNINNCLLKNEIKIPIYVTQYGMTISHYNILHDTLYIANYIAKNVIDNIELAKSLTYYRLTDFQATAQNISLFDGGTGLYYKNLLPKPALHALKFISKLEDIVMSRGTNHILTRNQDKNRLVLLLHNYEHPNDTLVDDNVLNVPLFDRYSPFVNKTKKRIHLNYKTDYKKAYIHIYSLDKDHGSPYDRWLQAGKPPVDAAISQNIAINAFLKVAANPDYSYQEKIINLNLLNLEIILKPLELKLIEIDLENL